MNLNLPFQIFAWIASIFFAVEVVGTKLLSKYEIKNPWLLNFGYSGLVMVFTVPLALYFHAGLPIFWGNVVWAGIFWAIANICYIFALYRFDVTTLSPLFNVRIVFTVILSVLLLSEKLNALQLIFIGAMFLGGVLVAMDEKISWRSVLNLKSSLILLAMWLAFSLDAVFIKKAIGQNGYWTVTLWMPIIAQILFCFTLPKFAGGIKKVTSKQGWLIFLIGVLDFFGTLAANKAYQTNVSISSSIISLPLSSVLAFTLFLAVPKLLEKHTTKVYAARFVGTVLIILAAIKLS
jgi:drug/metabolite transporter (DMT)-like permease